MKHLHQGQPQAFLPRSLASSLWHRATLWTACHHKDGAYSGASREASDATGATTAIGEERYMWWHGRGRGHGHDCSLVEQEVEDGGRTGARPEEDARASVRIIHCLVLIIYPWMPTHLCLLQFHRRGHRPQQGRHATIVAVSYLHCSAVMVVQLI
jgi:hypothetical protein